jgi:hypothetical protein
MPFPERDIGADIAFAINSFHLEVLKSPFFKGGL